MSDVSAARQYHLVSTLHAARVTLANARKAGYVAAVAAAEGQVAAARAAVNAALADGRVTSAKHLLDLDLDCLGVILSHLGPRDALSVARTCTTLRAALFRGGLPGPLAGVCSKVWFEGTPTAAALRALDGMDPALGALRLKFTFDSFDEDRARLLARALLDLAPRAARIDITLPYFNNIKDDDGDRLADFLTSPDRAFAVPPQVHVQGCDANIVDADKVLRLTRAGVCVASMEQSVHDNQNYFELIAANAASTLTQLKLAGSITLSLRARFPALRRLILDASWDFYGHAISTNMPSLTALAPLLKEIEFCSNADDGLHRPPELGFGFEPRRFARFVAAIQGVTRVRFVDNVNVTLSRNENENLGQLATLRTLRDLEISCWSTYVSLAPQSSRSGPPRPPVAEDAVMNLPPLPPGLTRLAFSYGARVAFGHLLPDLRVLDLRDSSTKVFGASFNSELRTNFVAVRQKSVVQHLAVPLAIPSAAIAPNLHTLLISYVTWSKNCGDFDLWTLMAARTALRRVVIENARVLCGAPDGFDTTTAGFAALLAREAKDLLSIHVHRCTVKSAHKAAAENFLSAFKERGGRLCFPAPASVKCVFCVLHDGTDLWRRW